MQYLDQRDGSSTCGRHAPVDNPPQPYLTVDDQGYVAHGLVLLIVAFVLSFFVFMFNALMETSELPAPQAETEEGQDLELGESGAQGVPAQAVVVIVPPRKSDNRSIEGDVAVEGARRSVETEDVNATPTSAEGVAPTGDGNEMESEKKD